MTSKLDHHLIRSLMCHAVALRLLTFEYTILEFSQESGYLSLSPAARSRLNISVVKVYIGESSLPLPPSLPSSLPPSLAPSLPLSLPPFPHHVAAIHVSSLIQTFFKLKHLKAFTRPCRHLNVIIYCAGSYC